MLLLSAVLILPIASAQAARRAKPPKRSDIAAARALVAAQTGFFAAGLATRREATSDVNAFIGHVKAQCPNALPATLLDGGGPKRNVYTQLFTEASYDAGLAALTAEGDAIASEARALDRIHFSKRAVTRDVRNLARSQRASIALAPSDVCADIAAAAAGGFAMVPPGTTQFVSRVLNALAQPAPSFNTLLADIRPYVVSRQDVAAIKRMRALGVRYTDFIAGLGIDAGGKLADALGASS